MGSRIPPPRNVSEIGGYFNLLSSLNETTMREQALAGILGVAGPAQPLASHVLNPAQYSVEPADLLALQCTPATCSVIQLSQVSYVPIGPIFAAAGFYSPLPGPDCGVRVRSHARVDLERRHVRAVARTG